MFKRLFVGILIGLLAFGALYLYFLYTGDTAVMLDRVWTHQLYSLIFFASIVLLYILQANSRIFGFLIVVIILINLFILGDVFFKNNIGLNQTQFLTLFGLIVIAILISYVTHRIRFVFMAIVGLGIGFVLLTGALPLYENVPSLNDFIQSQKARIINKGASDGILLIKNALGTKEIPVSQLNANDIDLSQKTQISLASKTKGELEKVFIDLGNGAFININPQSSLTLQQSGDQTTMQILQGNIEYHVPQGLSGALQIIGKYKGKNIQEVQNSIWSDLTSQFEKKKEEFFINEIGGSMILQPGVDKVIRFVINTLYNISPKTYQKNLTNYNTLQQYFGKMITGNVQNFQGENLRSIIDDIMGQVKKGAEETKVNQWLK